MELLTQLFTSIKTSIRSLLVNEDEHNRDPPEEHEVSGYWREQDTEDGTQRIWVSPHERGGNDESG